MREIAKVIRLIGKTSSTNDKLRLLQHYADLPGLKDVLKFIYNPYCKTGISDTKLSKAPQTLRKELLNISMYDAMNYFSTHQTGTEADVIFATDFINCTEGFYGVEAAMVAKAIVTQKLKIGITSTSLNKAYGESFIPKIGCMLGTKYDSIGAHLVQWPCIVTEKLDGVRRVLIKENGVCRFYSRSGHEDTGLVEILEEAKYLPNNFVYDGELLAKGTFSDSIALRQASNSLANIKGTKTGLTFNVFDMVPVKDFYTGYCGTPAKERKIRLAATFKDDSLQLIDDDWYRRQIAFGMDQELKHIVTVPILGEVKCLADVEPIVASIWAVGGEGVMLNTANGPYEIKRSRNLLKVKHTEEHVLTVEHFVEGTGKYENSLGSIVVNYNGNYVGVGSGFTDEQRKHIWENRPLYVGRKAEIETFGESTNAMGMKSLNCPIFKRFVGEVE